MTLETLLNKYVDNQIKINELKGMYLQKVDDETKIIDIMSSLSEEQRKIFYENEDILNKTVFYYKNHLELIDEDIYKIFKKFADKIAIHVIQIDTPIAYYVYSFLLEYSKIKNNLNLIIENSYNCGLSLFNLDKTLFREEIANYFKVALNYESSYFSLNKVAREYFNRCLGNYLMCYTTQKQSEYKYCIKLLQKNFEFWNRSDVRSMDPDFNYDTYIFVGKRNILTLLEYIRNNGPLDDESMEILYQYSKDIYYQKQDIVSETQIPVLFSYQYVYYAMQFHTSRITIEELLKLLESISTPLENDPYSLESRTRVIRGLCYVSTYLSYTNLSETSLYEKKIKIFNTISNYISLMPVSVYEKLLQNEIVTYVTSFTKGINEDDIINLVMDLTIYRHLPTFIHISMVSLISIEILKQVIKVIPEYLVSTLDLNSVEDVINSKELLIKTIEKSSLLHDIGKFFCLEYVSNFGRKLTDIEFQIIKNHPKVGYELLKNSKISNVYIEATLLHHCYYDYCGGYPEYSEIDLKDIKTKKLIEIITIADSIDAATDYLGRPYAKRKTLEQLLDEFTNEAGSRYSIELVNLLKDKSFFDDINNLITSKRVEVTIDAYKLFLKRKEKNN